MIVTTTPDVPGKRVVATIGLVRGSAIRTRHVFHDFAEWIRNLVGAELQHYTKMMGEAREQALDRMIADAERLGANGVVGIRFGTMKITSGAAEMYVYGTAVLVE
ncbi:MAG: YbjQ family protein [Planctomycetota bacterium]